MGCGLGPQRPILDFCAASHEPLPMGAITAAGVGCTASEFVFALRRLVAALLGTGTSWAKRHSQSCFIARFA